MPKSRPALIILFLICAVAIAPLRLTNLSAAEADDLPVAFEAPVSSADDPDPRNETSVAVSPKSDRIIAGASKVIVGGGSAPRGDTRVAYYHSSDGGHTWGSGLLTLETPQKIWSRASDPSVVADLDGNFYLCALMLDNASFDTGVYVFKSTDGGRTFGDPLPAVADIGSGTNPKMADKCYITVDTSPSSPFKNTIYAIWTSTERDMSGFTTALIRISWRRPGDAGFSNSKIISHQGDMRGPSITTGPEGELYAAWEGIGNPRVILFNASTDGGETFLPPLVAPSVDYTVYRFVGSLSPPSPALFINGVYRMNSFPVIDVDRSNGPHRGMIYIAWAETTNRIDSDVFILRMTPPNGGHPQISQPVRVNNDQSGADQFFPWLNVDSTTGAVEVAFYDQRDDPGGLLINAYLARSTDAGASFSENIKVSATGSDPRIQESVAGSNGNPIGIGDYIALAAARGKAHLMWTDTRRQKQEIFYGQVAFESSGGPGEESFDACLNPRAIATVPYQDEVDTQAATSSPDDPVSCSGNQDTNTVWYAITPAVDTVYGVETVASDYDTVLSVYAGACGALTLVACSDDFGSAVNPANRSMLTFAARAGVTYLIEVSGKGSGGLLRFRLGYPTITSIEYTSAPDDSDALKITGAGFVNDNATVIVEKGGSDNVLPTIFFTGDRQGDGTTTTIYATKKKLKKLVKRNKTVRVRIESPAGSGLFSVTVSFTR